MSAAPDVSIAIVNFNSAHFVTRLVESLRAQEWSIEGRPGRFEIIVVDNASRGEDVAILEELRAPDLRLIVNTINTGYGQANTQAYHVARGRLHVVLNPDAIFLPGCLDEMVRHLEEHPETAMASPFAFMDPAAQVLIPPNQLPTPELFELQTRAQLDHDAAAENLAARTRLSYRYWTATEPLELDMLSGSCFIFRRGLTDPEPLFDPGFPLYYEDTDLFLRLHRAGRRLVVLPAARFLHFWSQSADTHARGAQYRGRIAERRYFRKHFGEAGWARYDENRRRALETRDAGTHIVPFDFEEVAGGVEPPRFTLDLGPERYFIEMAGNPIFTLAAGFFPREAGGFTVTPQMWQQLPAARYYLRAVDRETFDTLRAWQVVKPGA
ncbi:MAG: glycosyltransferase family 2 protein [Planctomycetota bacterium]